MEPCDRDYYGIGKSCPLLAMPKKLLYLVEFFLDVKRKNSLLKIAICELPVDFVVNDF